MSTGPPLPAAEFSDLTGIPRGWISICRNALRDDPGSLDGLLAPSSRYTAVFKDRGRRPDRPGNPLADEAGDTHELLIAQAVAATAGALARPDRAGSLLRQAVAVWDRSLALLPGGSPVPIPSQTITADAPRAMRKVLDRLDDLDAGPAAAYCALVAAELTGARPKPGRTLEMQVLFDRNIAGSRARLRLGLTAGPPGLYPDPGRMPFPDADRDFHAALTAAWQTAPPGLRRQCVIWSLTDNGQPCNRVDGGSLGAAFAVCLTELEWRSGRRGRLRFTAGAPRCAVTGGVDRERQVLAVNGLQH